MKIRVQILLVVVPIFLVLGLVAGLVNYAGGREELLASELEQAYTLTLALSEFLGSERGRRFLEQEGGDPRLQAAVREAIDRNPMDRVTLLLKNGEGGVDFVGLAGPPAGVEPTNGSGGWTKEGILVSPILSRPDQRAYVRAVAPLADDQGAFGVAIIEVDASETTALIRWVLFYSGLFVIASAIVGILVSLLIGRMVTRAIDELVQATRSVAGGRYDWRVRNGWLRELNDLGNTFNTMTSLLDEILTRTKRAVIEGEQFRKPADLAESFAPRLRDRSESALGHVEVGVTQVGRRTRGEFVCILKNEDGYRLVLGRLASTDDFDSVVHASAALYLIRRELTTGSGEAGFDLTHRLFEFEYWYSAAWKQDGDRLDLRHWKSGEEEPTREELRLEPGRPLAIHGFQGEWAQKLTTCIELFDDLQAPELAGRLGAALGEPPAGSVVILSAG